MRIRSLLLAGAVVPFAMTWPGFARDAAPFRAELLLAQAEEACPAEGCAAAEEAAPKKARNRDKPARNQARKKQNAEQGQPDQAAAPDQPAPQADAPKPKKQRARKAQQGQPDQAAAPDQPAPQADAPKPKKQRARKAQQGQPDQAATEQPAAEQPAAEQQQAKPPKQRARKGQPDQAPAAQAEESGQPDQPAVEQTEAPAATGQGDRRKQAVERARRRQQQLQQGAAEEQPDGGEPAQGDNVAQPKPVQDGPSEAGQQDQAGQPDGAAESTVEQQLEAQGDTAEADKVRNLRKKLRDQARKIGPPVTAETAGESDTPDGGTDEGWTPDGGPGDDEDPPDGDTADEGPPPDGDTADQGDTPDGDTADEDGDEDTAEEGEDTAEEGWRPDRGRGRVVERRGDRFIIDLGGGRIVVDTGPYEGERLLYGARDVEVQRLRGGRTRTIVYRENGVQIVTIRDRRGNIISRVRVLPDGHEIVLIDNRYFGEGTAPVLFEPDQLPPLVVGIPDDRYVVDLGGASEGAIQEALLGPPVEQVERAYTLDEVTQNARLRDKMSRIDLDTITFDFGSATIGNDQMDALGYLGQAMEQIVGENPDEVYLIEGHTDAVGSDNDNLILSDQRAESVAVALSQNFQIPPENLVTEGYGEQYLKVGTEAAERQNRRVTVRRITPLLQTQAQQQ